MLYKIEIKNGDGIVINEYVAMIKNTNDEESLQEQIFNVCESFNPQPDQDISESDSYDYKTQNK